MKKNCLSSLSFTFSSSDQTCFNNEVEVEIEPTWKMYSTHPWRISTLCCKVGSTLLPSERPWKNRMFRMLSQSPHNIETFAHCFLFTIDQTIRAGFYRENTFPQSIPPSTSRNRSQWRKILVTFSKTCNICVVNPLYSSNVESLSARERSSMKMTMNGLVAGMSLNLSRQVSPNAIMGVVQANSSTYFSTPLHKRPMIVSHHSPWNQFWFRLRNVQSVVWPILPDTEPTLVLTFQSPSQETFSSFRGCVYSRHELETAKLSNLITEWITNIVPQRHSSLFLASELIVGRFEPF